ncbi:MAG: DUF3592 domain-containing protein [Acidimicrobiales bacterium]
MGLGDNIGNEAAAVPYGAGRTDLQPDTPALPWDNVRLGAEPPACRAAGSATVHPVLHDGPAALEALSTIRVSSPRCGHVLSIDPPAIVNRGTGRLAFCAAAPADLVEDVIRAFQLGTRDFDGRTVLTGTNGLAPSFAVLRCDECGQLHLTVVSYGEFQPERFQLIFEGLAAFDDTSQPIVLDAGATEGEAGRPAPGHHAAGALIGGDPVPIAVAASTAEGGPTGEPRLVRPGGAPSTGPDPGGPDPSGSGSPAATAGIDPTGPGTDLPGPGPDSGSRPLSAITTGELPLIAAGERATKRRPVAPLPPIEERTPGQRVLAIVAVALVAVAVVWVHASTWAAWTRSGDLANTGRATIATVEGTESFDTGSDKSYSVSYAYKAVDEQGRATDETGQQDVDEATFERANVDRTIEVRYDPAEPTRSAVARSDDLRTRYLAVVVFDVAVLVAAWRLWPRLRRYL